MLVNFKKIIVFRVAIKLTKSIIKKSILLINYMLQKIMLQLLKTTNNF